MFSFLLISLCIRFCILAVKWLTDHRHPMLQACKGFCSVYISRITSVPVAEVPSLLSSRTKPFVISRGTWVRMKNGNYKGDLAQVWYNVFVPFFLFWGHHPSSYIFIFYVLTSLFSCDFLGR
jgi:hypothetical protein